MINTFFSILGVSQGCDVENLWRANFLNQNNRFVKGLAKPKLKQNVWITTAQIADGHWRINQLLKHIKMNQVGLFYLIGPNRRVTCHATSGRNQVFIYMLKMSFGISIWVTDRHDNKALGLSVPRY